MKKIEIPIDTVKKDFELYLDIPDNNRIFFSGKFGIGKTYFLKDFFSQNKDKYETFHLYPVNYQIYGNEDVLDLVKYDILVELLNKDSTIVNSKDYSSLIDTQRLLYLWGKDNLKEIFTVGASLIPKLGRPIKEIVGLIDNFRDLKRQIENGEQDFIKNFLQNTKDKEVTETDYLSELLKSKITKLKKDKKSVLILDDLDRIDPDHIFRILNIFSAYFEKENENKFGFDIVIIVSDYENIKNIFHHKYGKETDFSGYLDKFFAISPYYFDNKKAVIDMADEIAKSIKNEEPNLSAAIGDSVYIKLFLRHFFTKAIDCEVINLRELLKATRYQLTNLRKGSYHKDPFSDNFQKIFDIAIKVSIHIFSNTDNFIEKIKTIRGYKTTDGRPMPFEKYIETMLKSFGITIPNEEKKNVMWKDYKISKASNGFSIINVADGREENLFYDLLIEYIKQRKYIKGSVYEYER